MCDVCVCGACVCREGLLEAQTAHLRELEVRLRDMGTGANEARMQQWGLVDVLLRLILFSVKWEAGHQKSRRERCWGFEGKEGVRASFRRIGRA